MVMRVLILTGGTVEENFAKDYIMEPRSGYYS